MSDLIRTIFANVLTVSLSTSVVIVLLFLFRRPLSRLRAGGRYLIWMLVIARLALPMTLPLVPSGLTLTLPLSFAVDPAVEAEAQAERDMPIETGTQFAPSSPESAAPVLPMTPAEPSTAVQVPVLTLPAERETQPISPQVTPAEVLSPRGDETYPPASNTALTPTPIEPSVSEDVPAVSTEPAAKTVTVDLTLIAAWLWLGVALIGFGIRFARGLALNARLSRLGRPLTDPALCRLYERLCIQMGLREVPAVRICPDLGSPLVYGFRRPVILLPEGMDAPGAFVGVTAHELTHIRRRDLWLKLLILAALSLHWFNPLAYFAARRFNEETELSCDEAVLRDLDEDARRGYGYVLLSILRRGGSRADGLTTQFKPDKRAVRARFEGILDLSPKKAGRAWIALTLAICITMGTFVACRVGDQTGGDATDDTTIAAETTNSIPDDTTTAEPNETTTAPSTDAPEPVVQSDTIPLDFTPVEPRAAELTPLCGENEKSYRNLGSRQLNIYTTEDLYVTTWEPISEDVQGLGFYQNDKGEQALILTPQGDEGFMIVEGIHGIGQMCEYRTLTATEIGDRQAIEVEYVGGTRSFIVIFYWENDQLLRWFGTANSLVRADLDRDGSTEYIANAGFMVPTYILYAFRDGKLCSAGVNGAFAVRYPDVEFVSVTYASACFTVQLQYQDRTDTRVVVYADGVLCFAEPGTVEIEIPLTFTPLEPTAVELTMLGETGAKYVIGEDSVSIRHADGSAENWIRISEKHCGLAVYECGDEQALIADPRGTDDGYAIVTPGHGYGALAVFDELHTFSLQDEEAILVTYSMDNFTLIDCYTWNGDTLEYRFGAVGAIEVVDLDGDGYPELVAGSGMRFPTQKIIAYRDGVPCAADVADAVSAYYPDDAELGVAYADGTFTVTGETSAGERIVLTCTYRAGKLIPVVSSPAVETEAVIELNFEPAAEETSYTPELIDGVGERTIRIAQDGYANALALRCSEMLGSDWQKVSWHTSAMMGFFRAPDGGYVLIAPSHTNYPLWGSEEDYTVGFRIIERTTAPGTITWNVFAGMSVIRVESETLEGKTINLYQWRDGALIRVLHLAEYFISIDLDGDGTLEYIGKSDFNTPYDTLYALRDGQLCRAPLYALDDALYTIYKQNAAVFAMMWDDKNDLVYRNAVYSNGKLLVGYAAPIVTSTIAHELNYILTGDGLESTTQSCTIRLPHVNLRYSQSLNEQIIADFSAHIIHGTATAEQFSQWLIPAHARMRRAEELSMQGFGSIVSLNVDYAYTAQDDGTLILAVDYVLCTQDGEERKTTYTYRANADGTLLGREVKSVESADVPSLTGDVYFKGICSADGSDYLLLHLTSDRLYFAVYPDNGRLVEETGLTSVFDEVFTLWQNYGTSVGMHSYAWDAERGGFVGDTFGDFRWGDLLVKIEQSEYDRLAAECEARLAREAADTSPAATIKLTTPIRNGDEEFDQLRVRIVNNSSGAIWLTTAYRLERRGEDLNWYTVACNGTPTFSATRYTVDAGQEAVLNYDLSVYTALLESGAFYRAVIPVRLSDGSEVELTCTFGGNGIGRVMNDEAEDWYYIACNASNYRTMRDFTLSLQYKGYFSVLYSGVDEPWNYIRFTRDSVTVYMPLSLFGSNEAALNYFNETSMTLRVDGTLVETAQAEVRYSETMAVARYTLTDALVLEEGMTLIFTLGDYEHVSAGGCVSLDGEFPRAAEEAILTAAVVGGMPRLYLFTEGLTFCLQQGGVVRAYTLCLPADCTQGRIVHAAPGAGSGELMVYVEAESSVSTVYLEYIQFCGESDLRFDTVRRLGADEYRLLTENAA